MGILASITGASIMSQIDKFLIDNPDYLVSLNDIVFTMLKPAVAIGLIFYDLLNFASSMITGSPELHLKLSSVENLRNDIIKPSQIALSQNGDLWKILPLVGKICALAWTELSRGIEILDKKADRDIDWFMMIIKTSFDFIFLSVTDVVEIVDGFLSGATNFSTYDGHNLFRSLCITASKVGVLTVAYVGAHIAAFTMNKESRNMIELAITWTYDILNWIIDIFSAGWNAVIASIFYLEGELSTATLIAIYLEFVASGVKIIYDIACSVTNHGTDIVGTGPVWVAYLIIAFGSILFSLGSIIVSYLIDKYDL